MKAISITFTTIIIILLLVITMAAIISMFRTGFTSAAEPLEGVSDQAGDSVDGFGGPDGLFKRNVEKIEEGDGGG